MCHLLTRKHTTDINACEERSGNQDACVFMIWKKYFFTSTTPFVEIQ